MNMKLKKLIIGALVLGMASITVTAEGSDKTLDGVDHGEYKEIPPYLFLWSSDASPVRPMSDALSAAIAEALDRPNELAALGVAEYMIHMQFFDVIHPDSPDRPFSCIALGSALRANVPKHNIPQNKKTAAINAIQYLASDKVSRSYLMENWDVVIKVVTGAIATRNAPLCACKFKDTPKIDAYCESIGSPAYSIWPPSGYPE